MATTPRYLGTTTSAAKQYLEDSLESEVYLAVFDADRDGTVGSGSTDETELARAVARAETKVDEILGASHGAPWSADAFAALAEGVRDSIKECALEMALWERVKFRPLMSDEKKAPYRQLWKDALARLKDLAADRQRRLGGSAVPEPTLSAGGVVEPDEDLSGDWTNAVAGNSTVGF